MNEIKSLTALKKYPSKICIKTATKAVLDAYNEGFSAGLKANRTTPTVSVPELILSAVMRVYGVNKEQIRSESRLLGLPDARKIFSHYADEADLNRSEIGEIINRSHSTVTGHLQQYINLYACNKSFRDKAIKVGELIKNK